MKPIPAHFWATGYIWGIQWDLTESSVVRNPSRGDWRQ